MILSDNRFKIFKALKMRAAKDFCNVGPKSRFLTPLLEEAYSYEFAEKPNYGKLKFMIGKMLMEEDQVPN